MSEEREEYRANEPERAPGAESGISSVASSGNRGKLAIAFLFLAIVVALVFVVLGTGGGQQVAETDEEPQEFQPTPVSDVPQAPPEPPPLPEPRPATQPAPQPQQRSGPSAADKKQDARRRSPMLIFNEGDGGAAAAGDQSPGGPRERLAQRERELRAQLQAVQSGQLPRGGRSQQGANIFGGSGAGGGGGTNEGFAQRNNAFAQRTAQDSVETVNARQISNLDYRINQGKMIRGTLETAIQSDLPGLLRAIVSENIYSANGETLLIPRGSRLIGEYRSGLVRGQTRVFVVWNRMIDPNGVDVALGSRGTDSLGRAGLTGVIDTHFAERFGASLLLSLIGSTAQVAQGDNTVVINTSESFSDAAEVALENSINIPPTVHVDQGTPIQVFVAKDLNFAPVLAGRR